MTGNKKETSGKNKLFKQNAVAIFLMLLWLALFSFAIIAMIEPTWLRELSVFGRTDESGALKDMGDNYLRQKNYGLAIAQYKKAVEINPEYAEALGNMAIAYSLAGNNDQAIKILKQSLVSNSSQAGATNINIADILFKQGRKEEAIEYLTRAIGSEVKQDDVYRRLGAVLYDLGRYQEAGVALEKAVQIQTDPTTPYRDMLFINKVLCAKEAEHLNVIDSLINEGISADHLGAFDLETSRRISHSNPNFAKTHNYLAMIDLVVGDTTAAIAHFEQSNMIWPNNADAVNALKLLKYKK